MPKIYAFTGKMYSGKNYVVARADLKNFSLSEPIHDVVRYFRGTSNKGTPGIREALQCIGRWGRGCVQTDDELVRNLATADEMRKLGRFWFAEKWGWVEWETYGTPDFWIRLLAKRIAAEPKLERCIVSSLRWTNEFEWVKEQKGVFVELCCSQITRQRRMLAAGHDVAEQENRNNDRAENIVNDFAGTFPELQASVIRVWNDLLPKPDEKMLTVAEFLAKLAIAK